MSSEPGYSGTPLPQKLGMKDGQRVLFLGLPDELGELKAARDFVEVRDAQWDTWRGSKGWDFVHGFTASRGVLEGNARPLMEAITRDGVIWISWPKKASKVPTDITEDVIREVVLPIGLVDIKVAAVSDVWSGLKLMIRKELR
ncbi:DUF3052 domain-containing protein [Devosia sp. ZB163]|uniref:DUF3052 domain-containing protein n=1 Tax=Devosia sp. ZB163 TaxID=3025938 RepID=UPI0023618196|nr:DUF3052 domain-containing protein [Devosia sp. ZB163]MDC9822149.1 DUF3052 domain-containing protein [Devosia sp. ZB163]